MITKLVIFAFITGLLSGGVVVGAITWSKVLGLKLNWWKWLMAGVWYLLLLVCLTQSGAAFRENEHII